jgi:hypothetical protein
MSAHHWAGYPKRNKEKKKTTHSIELKRTFFVYIYHGYRNSQSEI